MAQSDLVVHIGANADNFIDNINSVRKSIAELGQKSENELSDISAQFKKTSESTAPLSRKLKDIRKQMEQLATSQIAQTTEGKALYAKMTQAAQQYDKTLTQIQRDSRNSGDTLSKKIAECKAKMEELVISGKANTKEGQRMWKSLAAEAKGYKDAVEDINKSVKNGGKAFNIKEIGKEFAGKMGLGGAFDAITDAMSGPAGAVMAVSGAAVAAGKAFYDYNKELDRSLEKTAQFTGLSGNELNSLRNGIKSVADTFGKDYDTVLSAVDGMMAQFGLDGETALNIIRDGFVGGADDSGRMLDLISQYSGSFKDAGISASQLVAIIGNTRSGIFSEDGMALIQKAAQNIRLMSDTTANALGAIGISADEMTKKLADGSLSTVDAMKQISSKLKDLNPQSKEVGDVLKNVFGKQGAAAGMELVTALADVEDNLEVVKGQTGEWGESLQKVQEADRNLENALQSLFGCSEAGWNEMSNIIKGEIYQCLADVINYFIELYNESYILRKSIADIGFVFKTAWDIVKAILKHFAISIKGLSEMVSGLFELDWNKIATGWKNGVKSLFTNIKGLVTDVADNAKDALNQTLNGKIDVVQTVNSSTKKTDVRSQNASPKSAGSGKKSGGKSGSKTGGKSKSSAKPKEEKIDYLISVDDNSLDTAEKKLQAWTAKKKTINIDDKEAIAECDAEIKKWSAEVERRKLTPKVEIAPESLNGIKQQIKDKEDEIKLALNTEISPEAMQKLQDELDKLRKKEEAKEIELGLKVASPSVSRTDKKFERGSVEDKKQSLLNAQSMVSEIQENYKLKLIGKDEVTSQLSEINAQLEALGLKPITLTFNDDGTLTTAIEDLERFKSQMDSVSSVTSSVGSTFGSLGSAIGGTTGEIMNFAGQSISALGQIIPQIVTMITAKNAEAIAAGTASGASLPFPANIAAIASIVATIASVFASLPQFANGGIVGGSSFTGDKLLARVNSGEMILNKTQQNNLYNSMSNAGVGTPMQNTLKGDVTFSISGAALKGTLKNYDSKMSKIK